MKLGELRPSPGSTRKRTRLGRGIGSGLGKTSGRGHKGKGSRTGGNTPPGYEGGQMPLQRRVPKRGFRRLQKSQDERERLVVVNLKDIARAYSEGGVVDSASLVERGLAAPGMKIKILGDGELSFKLTVRADAFSASAREKIEKAGGTAETAAQATKE
ncbi:MAG TPA: 50S ribosomal protein L15 [Candidatus Binataceae bacterium]|nr:50S ribosomal protein L15 [Candidatus Binataceae bacterium]